jgi:hypothetical protein
MQLITLYLMFDIIYVLKFDLHKPPFYDSFSYNIIFYSRQCSKQDLKKVPSSEKLSTHSRT